MVGIVWQLVVKFVENIEKPTTSICTMSRLVGPVGILICGFQYAKWFSRIHETIQDTFSTTLWLQGGIWESLEFSSSRFQIWKFDILKSWNFETLKIWEHPIRIRYNRRIHWFINYWWSWLHGSRLMSQGSRFMAKKKCRGGNWYVDWYPLLTSVVDIRCW